MNDELPPLPPPSGPLASAVQLLQLLTDEFPYSTMSEGFKGKHHITADSPNMLVISVWFKDRLYSITYDTTAYNNSDAPTVTVATIADTVGALVKQDQLSARL